jgi:hypothetical protein
MPRNTKRAREPAFFVPFDLFEVFVVSFVCNNQPAAATASST